jgi:hypothetical protein
MNFDCGPDNLTGDVCPNHILRLKKTLLREAHPSVPIIREFRGSSQNETESYSGEGLLFSAPLLLFSAYSAVKGSSSTARETLSAQNADQKREQRAEKPSTLASLSQERLLRIRRQTSPQIRS